MNNSSEHTELNAEKIKEWCKQETAIQLANWVWFVLGIIALLLLLGALD